jgi:glutamate/aspartate transport system permease protein
VYDYDWSSIRPGLPFLWKGMKTTLYITIVAMAAGIALGTVLAILRMARNRVLAWLAAAYVNAFRSIPLVMVVLWFYLLMPAVIVWIFNLPRQADTALTTALVTFSLFQAAYYAEVIRAGIQSVKSGQVGAALALGMTNGQAMRLVVLPQAFRNMAPLLLTQTIILFQDTSLVYVSSLLDFFRAASIIGTRDGRPVELYLFAGAVYFVACFALSSLVKRWQNRLKGHA